MWTLGNINRTFYHAARYLLGTIMLYYAIVKLLNVQFQVSPFTYTRPLDQVPGRMLAWAYLGYAPWFQRLLGVAEFVPALMLFFRRTARLGAVLMFAVLLHITLVNFALDLWHDTKIISCQLLSLNIYLLINQWSYLREALEKMLEAAAPMRPIFRWTEATIPFVVLTVLCFNHYHDYERDARLISDFTGTRQINGAGAWAVEELRIDGKNAVPEGQRARLYFDVWQHAYYSLSEIVPCPQRGPLIPNQLSDKRAYRDVLESCSYFAEDRQPGRVESEGLFDADRFQHRFQLTNLNLSGSTGKIIGTYSANGRNLQMWGTRNGEKIEIVLKRLNWGKMW
jgi:methylamine utilization protein MauE